MKLPSYQELSKEQDRINGLSLDANWLVTGPPGTGKSVMALYRAQMLRKQKRSMRILTWSRLLKMYMANAVGELGLDDAEVQTFDKWFFDWWASEYGDKPPKLAGGGPYDHDWDEIHRIIGEREEEDRRVDLLIDEGQDLPSGFYLFAGDGCRSVTVFADENQTISERQSSIDDIRRYARIREPHELKRNYRNTFEIAQFARHFYSGLPTGIPDLPDRSRSGPKPRLRHVDSLDDSVRRIVTHVRNNPHEQIGVFTPTARKAKSFGNKLQAQGISDVQTYFRPPRGAPPEISFDSAGVLVTFAKNAKGLEFDTVFVPELNRWNSFNLEDPTTTMLLYVLSSRARTNLEFHWSGVGEPAILELFPEELMSRR